jgi:hypothetical protein
MGVNATGTLLDQRFIRCRFTRGFKRVTGHGRGDRGRTAFHVADPRDLNAGCAQALVAVFSGRFSVTGRTAMVTLRGSNADPGRLAERVETAEILLTSRLFWHACSLRN